LTDFIAEVRTDPDVGNRSHAEQREKAFKVSLFLRNFFRFLGSDVDLLLVFGRRFSEVPDPFSNSFANLG
jgi:hypothetical protein